MAKFLGREEADDVSSALSSELADSLVNIAMDQACLGVFLTGGFH